MNVLFAHDHRFFRTEGFVWSNNQFESTLWDRYLIHFENLTILARLGDNGDHLSVDNMELSSRANVKFELLSNLSSLRGLTINRAAAFHFIKEIVKQHDGVIARLPSEIGLLAISAARSLRKPYAVEVAGCPWDGLWNYGSRKAKAYAPVAWWRMRRAIANTDHVLYVTQNYLQKHYPSSAFNICAASNVILGEISKPTLANRLLRIESLGSRPIRLGLIGTLNGKFKGIQTCLAALCQIRDKIPPFEFHILGPNDPTYWQDCCRKQGLSDVVFFDGTLRSGQPVLNWLDSIDLYLQPSLKEGLPRSLIEAMSRACPTIASTVAGIPELLPPEDMISPGDSASLALLLRRRISDLDWMSKSASLNWLKSQDYTTAILEQKRSHFYSRFCDSI